MGSRSVKESRSCASATCYRAMHIRHPVLDVMEADRVAPEVPCSMASGRMRGR
jgi:hypothetical protein